MEDVLRPNLAAPEPDTQMFPVPEAPAPGVRGGRGRGRPIPTFQAASNRSELEMTIDLTVSPTASPVASQSRSPSNPPSPALQCPVCLDSFSAIKSRGNPCHQCLPSPHLPPSHYSNFQGYSWSVQSVATSSVGAVSVSASSLCTNVQHAGGGSVSRTITLSSSEYQKYVHTTSQARSMK